MPAEPQAATSRPRPLAPARAGSRFTWSCRKAHPGDGDPAGPHQVTGQDRDEYARHMRQHGAKPPKSAYTPWKPWRPPRPVTEYTPKPMDAGQRTEWVKVTEGHREHPGHLTDDGTYVGPSGAWIEESRQTRTGVIWSVADTASAWWVLPDDDPARPVYVKRAGKSWRDRTYGEGALYEMPGAAEAARTSALRAEIIRARGIFPVIDSQSSGYGRTTWGTSHLYLKWHSDPKCPRAAGKDRYDPGNRPEGIVYGYQPEGHGIRSLGQPRWTVTDVADVLVSGEQAPSCLCPDCITNLAINGPASPDRTGQPEPGAAPGTPASPDEDTKGPLPPPGPGSTPVRARFTVSLAAPATDAEFLASCTQLGDALMSLAAVIGEWADGLGACNLPASVLTPLRQASQNITGAASGAVQAATAFENEFGHARGLAARGMTITGQHGT